MPDITMCNGDDCPLKITCYRYLAVPGGWQSFFKYPPYDEETQKCESYWQTEVGDRLQKVTPKGES